MCDMPPISSIHRYQFESDTPNALMLWVLLGWLSTSFRHTDNAAMKGWLSALYFPGACSQLYTRWIHWFRHPHNGTLPFLKYLAVSVLDTSRLVFCYLEFSRPVIGAAVVEELVQVPAYCDRIMAVGEQERKDKGIH